MIRSITPFLLVSSLFAGSYDYNYSPLQKEAQGVEKDYFFYGDFEKIIRFDPIYFHDGSSQSSADSILDSVVKNVDTLKEQERNVSVTVIGHSFEENEDENLSQSYMQSVVDALVDRGLDKELISKDARKTKDKAATDLTQEGRDLSERVMVTIYVQNLQDSDGDGVFDKDDACPNTPKGSAVDEKGCLLDSDHDGVFDIYDECPNTPEGNAVDAKGCLLDTDKDGVLDIDDKCPQTPFGKVVDAKGCHTLQDLALNFETRSANIKDESYQRVENFAKFLKENSEYKVEIIGHTDSVGKDQANLKLSNERAKSVRDALISEGVDAKRITATGKGETKPIATNDTAEGRAKNRRIEARLYEETKSQDESENTTN